MVGAAALRKLRPRMDALAGGRRSDRAAWQCGGKLDRRRQWRLGHASLLVLDEAGLVAVAEGRVASTAASAAADEAL